MQSLRVTAQEAFSRLTPKQSSGMGGEDISKSVLGVLLSTVFLDFLGFTLLLPYLYFYAQSLDASLFAYGLMVSSFAIMQLVCAPIFGRLSDIYGRRTVIVLSLAGSGISYLVFGLSSALWLVLFSRMLGGAFSSTYPIVQAYVAEVTDKRSRLKYLGFVAGAYGLAYVVGPVLGGALSSGLGYPAPALLASLLAFSNALLAYLTFPRVPHGMAIRSKGLRPSFKAIADLVNKKEENLLLVVNFASTFVFVLMLVVIPPWMEAVFSFGALQTGLLLSYAGGVSIMTVAFVIPWLSRRFSASTLVLGGMATVSLNYLGLGLVHEGSFWTLALVVTMAGLLSFGFSLVGPGINTLISIASLPREQGKNLGVAKSTAGMAQVVAPSTATFFFTLGTSIGLVGLSFFVAMIISLTALPLVLALRGPQTIWGRGSRFSIQADCRRKS